MNPNHKAFAKLRVNDKDEIDFGLIELKQIPIKLAKAIMQSDLSGRDFSSLELRINKRPIVWDSSEIGLNKETLQFVQTHNGDEPIDSESPIITYNEYFEVISDPIWSAYAALKSRLGIENTTQEDYQLIVSAWNNRYAQTKFARLI